MKYHLIKWVNNHITGKLLVAQYKQEKSRGEEHMARHSLAAVVYGNSEWCSPGSCIGLSEDKLIQVIVTRAKEKK